MMASDMDEIETTHEEAVEVRRTRDDLEAFRRALESGQLEVEVDPIQVQRRIVSEILDAPDVEAAFADRPLWSARDCVGRSFELRGLHLHASQFEAGAPVYASVDAVDLATGEVGVLNTSAVKHLAKLYVLERDQAWPVKVRITQALRPTASGYYPLDFELLTEDQG